MDKMVWVDLETTGLDPRREEILEIGIKITDLELNVLGQWNWLLNPWGDRFQQGVDICDPLIIEMHTKSELFNEIKCLSRPYNCWDGDLEKSITFYLEQMGAVGFPMCGNNVPFDRAFLTEHLPKVAELFHYRNLDVSSIKNAYKIEVERWRLDASGKYKDSPEWQAPESKHRVLPDLGVSILEYQFYREHLFR